MYPEDSIDNWHSGQGLCSATPEVDWSSWSWQLRNKVSTLSQLEEYLDLSESEKEGCQFADKKLSMAITPHFFNLIDFRDSSCPIRRQVIPSKEEKLVGNEELLDPVGEDAHSPVPGIVHRYPDRVLFLITDRCAAYCRYCTRSRMVSNAQDYNFHPELEQGLTYIEENQSVRDVLLSGGDPLLLSDRKLDYLLQRLKKIPHLEFIRIGSRIPVFLPQRITDDLANIFARHGPVWLSIHVNHPKECTLELKQACDKLALAGVPLGNQSVLLRGINDDLETMKSLVHRLLMMRVRPYYLYQCDLITGSSHLRSTISKGVEIIRGLRGHTSGYAIPQLVIDAPGGGGKVPINPEFVTKVTDDEIHLKNFQGKTFKYPLGKEMGTPCSRDSKELFDQILA
ncbi:MAG: lysine 2,3-aminomutase [Rhodospirillaceae bacterium]|nr:lysine 2,3-aminomutase [Rhodospirillaceae bacterium]